jgi:hypothetical protein
LLFFSLSAHHGQPDTNVTNGGGLQESRSVLARFRDSFRRSSSGNSLGQSHNTDSSGPIRALDYIDPDSKAAGFVKLEEEPAEVCEDSNTN